MFILRKLICVLLIIGLLIPVSSFSLGKNEYSNYQIPVSQIVNADISINTSEPDCYIEIKNDGIITNCKSNPEYEQTCYRIYSDSLESLENYYLTLLSTQNNAIRGSGSYDDSMSFYSDTLCIGITLYYTTVYENGIQYGKINKAYVHCSVYNSTVIDSLSILYGEVGFSMHDGYVSYSNTNNILNHAIVNYPSAWPYIRWDGSVGSSTGATVTAKIHRGTSTQKTYSYHLDIFSGGSAS